LLNPVDETAAFTRQNDDQFNLCQIAVQRTAEQRRAAISQTVTNLTQADGFTGNKIGGSVSVGLGNGRSCRILAHSDNLIAVGGQFGHQHLCLGI
jgi:hypothetical protein